MEKVTVVTICYNEALTIERTINSVLNQTHPNIEYIIKDGGSTDLTNDIIDSYQKKFEEKGIKYLHLNGKDKGIYDAMNIALEYSSGNWVNFMNAGDSFYNENVLKDIFNGIIDNDYNILYGHTLYELAKGCKYVIINDHNMLLNRIGLNQQSCFYRHDYIIKNKFSLDYKILSDYDLLLNAYINKVKMKPLNIIVACYNRYGVSSTNVYQTKCELYSILDKYGLKEKNEHINYLELLIKEKFAKMCPYWSDLLFCIHSLQRSKKESSRLRR